MALSPVSLWHYTASHRHTQSSEILSSLFICSYLCISNIPCLQPRLPASPTKKIKIMPKIDLLFMMLTNSFMCYRNQTLSHYHLLPYNDTKVLQAALTSVSSRKLLPGTLSGLQVPCFQNSFPRHQGSLNLPGVTPFTQLTVSLSSFSCSHKGLFPCLFLLFILRHGSVLFTELSEKKVETHAKEAFQYMK